LSIRYRAMRAQEALLMRPKHLRLLRISKPYTKPALGDLHAMSTNRKNKYNTSRKTNSWFPFAKHLFFTDNHPIRLSQDKCSSSIEALFCQQELEQINGIANSLQCETRDAIRIALYETIINAQEAHEKSYEKARSGSSIKGHEGRKTPKRFNITKTEKQSAEQAAEQLEITLKEFVRLAIIWLADGVKEESITRLTNSRRIAKDEVAKQWSRQNQGKAPSEAVAKLKQARDKAYEEAARLGDEYDKKLYEERGMMINKLNESGIGRVLRCVSDSVQIGNGEVTDDIDLGIVDAHLAIEHEDWVEQALKAESQRRDMNELEREILRTMLSLSANMPHEDIEAIAKEIIQERNEDKKFHAFIEQASDEELIDADLFWELRTPFTWDEVNELNCKTEQEFLRREGETAQDYVMRLLPEHLVPKWNAYCSD
jgi:hypothetical protein